MPGVNPQKYAFPGRNKVSHKPLRTAKELAEEFGISSSRLCGLVGSRNGPKSRLSTGSARWFDPDEVRAWWRALPEEVRNGGNA